MAQGPMNSIMVTIRITVRIRESVPDHDPEFRIREELAFGGGLCSLSILLVLYHIVNQWIIWDS